MLFRQEPREPSTPEDEVDDEDSTNFEIGATDECEFVPLVSEEEDLRIAAEMAPKSRYIPLDPDHPTVDGTGLCNVLIVF